MIFVALRPAAAGGSDGHDFIAYALEAGSPLVICESKLEKSSSPADHQMVVPDTRLALARLASRFYGNPSHSMIMVGVTGTSGKTTNTYLIESILSEAGHRVGVIGTVSIRYGDKVVPAQLTTPGAVELQKTLREMKDAGCTAVVMEVSSHALKQRRAAFVAFDAVVFTNLSPEHLDYHPDMEDYYASKKILFSAGLGDGLEEALVIGKTPFSVINADDPYGRRLAAELRKSGSLKIHEFKLEEPGEKLELDFTGVRGTRHGIKINSKLVGAFNAQNVLGALEVGTGWGSWPDGASRSPGGNSRDRGLRSQA